MWWKINWKATCRNLEQVNQELEVRIITLTELRKLDQDLQRQIDVLTELRKLDAEKIDRLDRYRTESDDSENWIGPHAKKWRKKLEYVLTEIKQVEDGFYKEGGQWPWEEHFE